MQFSTIFVAALATLASASAVEKRVDIPGLKCGGLDALSKFPSFHFSNTVLSLNFSLIECAAALSPAAISCIAAAVQAGVG